jgi:PAS domain S-box-containing protein
MQPREITSTPCNLFGGNCKQCWSCSAKRTATSTTASASATPPTFSSQRPHTRAPSPPLHAANWLIFASAYDITHHKSVQEQLLSKVQESNRFRTLIESTSDFVGIADLTGIVTYINPAGLRLLGLELQDVMGKSLAETHPPEHSQRMLTEYIPYAVREGTWSGEAELLSKSGEVIPMTQVLVPLRSPSGAITHMATLIRDARPQKQLAKS